MPLAGGGGRERNKLRNRYVDTFASKSTHTSAVPFAAPSFGVNSQQPASSLVPQAGAAQAFQQARPENVNRFVPTIPSTSSPEAYNTSLGPGEVPHLSSRSRSSSGYDLADSSNPPPMVSTFNEAEPGPFQHTGLSESADNNGFVPDPSAVTMIPRSQGTSEDQANAEDSFEEISL